MALYYLIVQLLCLLYHQDLYKAKASIQEFPREILFGAIQMILMDF